MATTTRQLHGIRALRIEGDGVTSGPTSFAVTITASPEAWVEAWTKKAEESMRTREERVEGRVEFRR